MPVASVGGVPTQFPAITLVNSDGSSYTPSVIGQATSSAAVSGRYYMGGSNRTTISGATGMFRPMVYDIPACTITRLFSETTVGGTVGSVLRFGVYGSTSTNDIGDLILDAGTADSTIVGIVEVTISLALTGGRYFLVGVPQGAPATPPTLRSCSVDYRHTRGGTALEVAQNVYPGRSYNNQTGALGAPGATLGMTATMPLCGYKVA